MLRNSAAGGAQTPAPMHRNGGAEEWNELNKGHDKQPETGPFGPAGRLPSFRELPLRQPLHVPSGSDFAPPEAGAEEGGGDTSRDCHCGCTAEAPNPATVMPQGV